MKTNEQLKSYVPVENLMPSDVIAKKQVSRYMAVPTTESNKMYVLTKNFPCPQCGVKSMLRSWDDRRSIMMYHCEGCGNDLALTWKEVVVLRATGKLRYENGELVVPEGMTIPEVPEDPNSLIHESAPALREQTGLPPIVVPYEGPTAVFTIECDPSVNFTVSTLQGDIPSENGSYDVPTLQPTVITYEGAIGGLTVQRECDSEAITWDTATLRAGAGYNKVGDVVSLKAPDDEEIATCKITGLSSGDFKTDITFSEGIHNTAITMSNEEPAGTPFDISWSFTGLEASEYTAYVGGVPNQVNSPITVNTPWSEVFIVLEVPSGKTISNVFITDGTGMGYTQSITDGGTEESGILGSAGKYEYKDKTYYFYIDKDAAKGSIDMKLTFSSGGGGMPRPQTV